MKQIGIQLLFKRLFDIVVSLILLILLSPLLIIIAVLIKLESPGEVFYRQERIGKDEKPFRIFKFRSMVKNAESKGAGLYMEGENDPRITKTGRFIRKTSLDELPQIINVFIGEMSLVGPRPMITMMYNKLNAKQRNRSKMRPGITGLAQVNGRNDIKWSKRIEFDNEYCENFNLFLDIQIFIKTVKVVFKRDNIRMDQTACDVDDLGKD